MKHNSFNIDKSQYFSKQSNVFEALLKSASSLGTAVGALLLMISGSD
jgi:hypothetical protein